MVDWERKKRFFVKHLEGEPMARLCRMLRIGRKTGYRWLECFQDYGLEGLVARSAGGRPCNKIPSSVSEAVVQLREQYGWNEKRIKRELEDRGVHASYYRVRQALEGRLRTPPERRRRTFKSFERPLPNHLWQGDFSLLEDNTWLFALLDDYSRYLIDAMEFEELSTENALFVVRRATARHGIPYQLMTDHGVQFYDNTRKQPNAFGQILETWKIQHILAGVKRPQTNGKIEKWFDTYKTESPRFKTLQDYLHHYNYCRPHGGINYQKPYERYYAFKL